MSSTIEAKQRSQERAEFLSKAKEQERIHREELGKLRKDHEAEKDRLDKALKSELAERDRAHSAHVSEQAKSATESMEKAKRNFFEKLEEERSKNVNNGIEERNEYNKELTRLQKEFKRAKDSERDRHFYTENSDRSRYDEAVADQKAKYEKTMREALSDQRDRTQATIDKMTSEKRNLAKEFHQSQRDLRTSEVQKRMDLRQNLRQQAADMRKSRDIEDQFKLEQTSKQNARRLAQVKKERDYASNIKDIKDAQQKAIHDRKREYVQRLKDQKQEANQLLTNQQRNYDFKNRDLHRVFNNNKQQMEGVHQQIQDSSALKHKKHIAGQKAHHEDEVRELIREVERVSRNNNAASKNLRREQEIRHQDELAGLRADENKRRLTERKNQNKMLNTLRKVKDEEMDSIKLSTQDQLEDLRETSVKNMNKMALDYQDLATDLQTRNIAETLRGNEKNSNLIQLMEDQHAKQIKLSNRKLQDTADALRDATGSGNSQLERLKSRHRRAQEKTMDAFNRNVQEIERDKSQVARQYKTAMREVKHEAAEEKNLIAKRGQDEIKNVNQRNSKKVNDIVRKYRNTLSDQRDVFHDTIIKDRERAKKRFDNMQKVSNENIKKLVSDHQENFDITQKAYAKERSELNAVQERKFWERLNEEKTKFINDHHRLEQVHEERLSSKDREIENIEFKKEKQLDNLEKQMLVNHKDASRILEDTRRAHSEEKSRAIKRKQEEFQREVYRINKQAERRTRKLQVNYDRELRDQKERYKAIMRDMIRDRLVDSRRKEAAFKDQLARQVANSEAERKKTISQFEDKIEKMQAVYEDKIAKAKQRPA